MRHEQATGEGGRGEGGRSGGRYAANAGEGGRGEAESGEGGEGGPGCSYRVTADGGRTREVQWQQGEGGGHKAAPRLKSYNRTHQLHSHASLPPTPLPISPAAAPIPTPEPLPHTYRQCRQLLSLSPGLKIAGPSLIPAPLGVMCLPIPRLSPHAPHSRVSPAKAAGMLQLQLLSSPLCPADPITAADGAGAPFGAKAGST